MRLPSTRRIRIAAFATIVRPGRLGPKPRRAELFFPMNTLRLILRVVVLGLAIPLSCRADHLVDILPDNPLLVVSAADVKRLQELPEHKVVKLIATPELQKAFGPLLTRADEALAEMQATWKKETGLEAKE